MAGSAVRRPAARGGVVMMSLMTRDAGVHLHCPLVSRRAGERNHLRVAIEAIEPGDVDVPGVREHDMLGEPQERIPSKRRAAGEQHLELLLGRIRLADHARVATPALCE